MHKGGKWHYVPENGYVSIYLQVLISLTKPIYLVHITIY